MNDAEYYKQYYKRNKEKRLAQGRVYYQKHKERYLESAKIKRKALVDQLKASPEYIVLKNEKIKLKALRRQEATKRAFWMRVGKRSDIECWNWTGTRYKGGYGRLSKGGYAHRFSYQINKGDIPKGMCVCHSCDNPSCVNPNHLWLGTMTENIRDRDLKGRGRHGVTVFTKLSPTEVLEIRRTYVPKERGVNNLRGLANRFNVGVTTVRDVVTRRTWKKLSTTSA